VTLLLVDVGNTRAKWARLANGRMEEQQAAAINGWTAEEYARRIVGRKPPERIVVSSVAGRQIDQMLVAAARAVDAPRPEFVRSARRAAGVTTDYLEPWRLGVDRFVGAIGAHHLAAGEPVVVVSVGTAVTVDLVDKTGRHRGGSILPGPALMVSSLLRHTSGIRRRAFGGAKGAQGLFARATRTAIEQGGLYAVAAVVDRAVEDAHWQLGRRPIALLTGGGAQAIKPLVRSSCVTVPDLVLHGLAVWSNLVPTETARRKRRA
jgi:type III pantothenate kinase